MAGTWFCLKCYKEMGNKQYCPHCGAHRLGDITVKEQEPCSMLMRLLEGRRKKQTKATFAF